MTEGVDGSGEPKTPFPAAAEAETGEGGEQKPQGLGPRYQRVSSLLTRLAATARSFLLYDAGNDAINRFLTALLDSIVSTLQSEGQLVLAVFPYELKLDDRSRARLNEAEPGTFANPRLALDPTVPPGVAEQPKTTVRLYKGMLGEGR